MTEVIAIGKNFRISPKKLRVVADNFRGKNAKESLESLRFVTRKAAAPLSKVLKSAIANGKNNLGLNESKLIIKEILVDSGPTLKRFQPVSRGSAHSILKRSSHLKIVLEGD